MSIKPLLDIQEKMLNEREKRLNEREKSIAEKAAQKEPVNRKETLVDCIREHYENAK